MPRFQHPLDHVSVASPCPTNWDDTIGTERARFCGQCSLNVYNLSAMTRTEAEDSIAQSEGRLCVRFFRRADGTILTENCPVGLAAFRARVKRRATAVLTALLTFMSGVGIFSAFGESSRTGETIQGAMLPVPRSIPGPQVMGTLVAPDREEVVGMMVTLPPKKQRKPKRAELD